MEYQIKIDNLVKQIEVNIDIFVSNKKQGLIKENRPIKKKILSLKNQLEELKIKKREDEKKKRGPNDPLLIIETERRGRESTDPTSEARVKMFYGKKDDDNATPKDFYWELHKDYDFTFDPCPLFGAELASKDPKYNGLTMDWGERNFVNPPFSEIEQWIRKAVEEMQKGKFSFMICPTRTNSKYWKEWVYPYACEIWLLERGLCFGLHKTPIPMPMAALIFDPKRKALHKIHNRETFSYYEIINNVERPCDGPNKE